MSAQRGKAYRSFFQALIDELRESRNFTNARAAQPRNFYHFTSGAIPGVYYDAFFDEHGRVVASVLIDVGKGREETRTLFDWLERDRAAIESEFGSRLKWSKPADVRACSIGVARHGSIEGDAEALQDIHAWFVKNLLKLKKVFGPRLLAYEAARGSQSSPADAPRISS